jgi:L-histidine N-alpha-methyltransferase
MAEFVRTGQSTTDEAAPAAQFAADVHYYLLQSPRQLPSRYFYDELGSALFEAICRLPWYRITRAESRLLTAHGSDVFRHLGSASTIVELGSGSGDKLRLLIEASGPRRGSLDIHLVDVSASALESSARMLNSLDHLRVATHQATYEAGLADVARHTPPGAHSLVLFLGSNIGNFDPPGAEEFLRNIRANLGAGDALLLGADLVKPERDLLLAYDDPLGVTAAFNRNLLVRINRELGGDFDIDRFAHRAVWNAADSRVEMHLVADTAQQIHV